jgi:hypothetical protein
VKKMKALVDSQLQYAQDRYANDLRAAANARLVGRSPRPERQSVRRALGRRIVAIGARVAAEPSIQPARSR